jgi:hypothetical protein
LIAPDRTVKAKIAPPKKKIMFIREEEDFMAEHKRGQIKAVENTEYAVITQQNVKKFNEDYCKSKGLNPPLKKATANLKKNTEEVKKPDA